MMPYKHKFALIVQKLRKKGTFEFSKLIDYLKTIEEMVKVDTFLYSNRQEELEGRATLLDLWEHLMDLSDIVPHYRQSMFYTLIFFIVTRYEFDLINMITRKAATKKLKFRKSKIEVHPIILTGDTTLKPEKEESLLFQRYKNLLSTQTSKVLEQFSQKSLTKTARKFCLQILSVAYFRIPSILGILINSCTSDISKKSKIESHGSSVDSSEIPPNLGRSDEVDTFFKPWIQRGRTPEQIILLERKVFEQFDKLVSQSSEGDTSNKELTTEFFEKNPSLFQWNLFSENEDRDLLSKASSIAKLSQDKYVFKFISRIIAHISDVLHCTSYSPPPMDSTTFQELEDVQKSTNKDKRDVGKEDKTNEKETEDADDFFYQFQLDGSIRWGLIPGYWSLVRAVLKRSLIPLDFYRTDLKRCVLRLLNNPDLLGIFVQLYLFSTSSTRKHEVNCCIDLIDSAFDAACGPNLDGSLPESFCFDEFFSAVDSLLASEQFEILLKTLCFLYTHAGRFYGTHRMRLLQKILIHKYFFKLFTHWYPAVRRQYHHILVYKLNRNGLTNNDDPQQVRLDITDSHRIIYTEPETIEDSIEKDSSSRASRSWIRRMKYNFVKMFSDPNPTLGPRRYSPSLSEDHKESKIGSDALEALHQQELARSEAIKEPPLDSCEIIRHKLTKDDALEDEVLENNVQVYVYMLESQMKDSTQRHFDPSLSVYVQSSLEQYRDLRLSMQKLQHQKKLRRNEVLTPSMYYDISKDNVKDIVD